MLLTNLRTSLLRTLMSELRSKFRNTTYCFEVIFIADTFVSELLNTFRSATYWSEVIFVASTCLRISQKLQNCYLLFWWSQFVLLQADWSLFHRVFKFPNPSPNPKFLRMGISYFLHFFSARNFCISRICLNMKPVAQIMVFRISRMFLNR